MLTENEVVEQLTRFYRTMDDAVSERAPAWQLFDGRRRSRQTWRMQLLATAALLALVVGIGILIRESHLLKQATPVTTPGPRSGAGLVMTVPDAPWRPMGLIDNRAGWRLTGLVLSISRDGGRTWRDITPPKTPICCIVSFLNENEGWAVGLLSADSMTGQVFRTRDGGASWVLVGKTNPLSLNNPCCAAMFFVDGQHGWIIDREYDGHKEMGLLEETSDGGAHWTLLPRLPALPFEQPFFRQTALRFSNPTIGWFVGSTLDGAQHLYRTNDGGHSWEVQDIPLPASEWGQTVNLTVPSFVSRDRAVLPVTLGNGDIYVATSTDSGASWRLESGMSTLFSGAVSFPAPTSAAPGVIALVVGDRLIVNDGRSWSVSKPSGLAGTIEYVEFANRRVGWALTSHPCNTVGCEGIFVELVKTTDGGRTWRDVRS